MDEDSNGIIDLDEREKPAPYNWDRKRCIELIEIFRTKPELWDISHNFYHVKSKKNEAWEDIAAQMNCDLMSIRGKINSLLSSWRREKNKIRADGYKSNWFAYDQFYFLLNKNSRKSGLEDSRSSTKEPQRTVLLEPKPIQKKSPPIEKQIKPLKTKEIEYVQVPSSESVYQSPPGTVTNAAHSNKKRRLAEDPDSDLLLQQQQQHINHKKIQNRDEFSIFGEHIANELRNLSNKKCFLILAQTKQKINSALYEAEIKRIQLEEEHPLPTVYTVNVENIVNNSPVQCIDSSSPPYDTDDGLVIPKLEQ